MLKDIPLRLRLMAFGHSFGDLMVSLSQTTHVRAATYYYVNERGKKMVFLCLEGGTPSATALLVPLPKEGQLIPPPGIGKKFPNFAAFSVKTCRYRQENAISGLNIEDSRKWLMFFCTYV